MFRSSGTAALLLGGAVIAGPLIAGPVIAGPALAGTEVDAASVCLNDASRFRQELDSSSLPPTERADAGRMLDKARDHAEGGNVGACRDAIRQAHAQVAAARRGETPGGDGGSDRPASSREIPAGERPTTSRGITTGPSAAPSRPEAGSVPQNTVTEDVGRLVQNAGLTDIEGAEVTSAEGTAVGNVEKVVQTRDGQKTFLVVGVGGFLGLGDHDVALPLSEFEAGDGQFALPGYDRVALERHPVYEESQYEEVPLPDVLDTPSAETPEREDAPPVTAPD